MAFGDLTFGETPRHWVVLITTTDPNYHNGPHRTQCDHKNITKNPWLVLVIFHEFSHKIAKKRSQISVKFHVLGFFSVKIVEILTE